MGSGIYACLRLGKLNVMGLEEKIAKLLKMTFVSSSTSNLFLYLTNFDRERYLVTWETMLY